jgi:hypothetical protein
VAGSAPSGEACFDKRQDKKGERLHYSQSEVPFHKVHNLFSIIQLEEMGSRKCECSPTIERNWKRRKPEVMTPDQRGLPGYKLRFPDDLAR